MPRFASPGRISWIVLALFLFSILGTGVVAQYLVRNEQKVETREILNKGEYLTSIIALNDIEDFKGGNRENFLRTFREHLFSERLAYCLIHDNQGNTPLVLAPQGLLSSIPEEIRMKSLHSMGLIIQTFNPNGTKYPVYEFAKPMFQNGEKTGTVRLGFKAPFISVFSSDRISFLAMVAFFIFATGASIYYGMAHALRPLKQLYQSLGIRTPNTGIKPGRAGGDSGFIQIVEGLEQSYVNIRETLKQTETDHAEIASKLGVATFEKNQIYRIIDAINFGIVITDIQSNVIHINTCMLNVLKKKRNETINRPLGDIISDGAVISFVEHHEPMTSTSQMEIDFPEFAPKETFKISLSYLKDDEGSMVGKMVSVQNITDRKSAERLQHDTITHITHSLQAPLATVQSYTEMLINGEVTDMDIQMEFYNTIHEEIHRLSVFTQNLRCLSKIENGELMMDKGLVKTDALIADCAEVVETAASKKQISIKKNLPDNIPALVGDKELLKTALVNLLDNAVKYSPENADISFMLHEEDSAIALDIVDTGYGISQEDMPLVFNKFYRSNDRHVAEQKGSGLGLTMSSEIIHLHGGEIEVTSKKNEGTRYTVRLPKEVFYIGTE